MSNKTQAPVNATTKPSLNADKSGLLQRQCACGNSAGLTGECATCQTEKLTLQRKQTAAQDKVSEVPPIAHEALSLPRVPFIQAKLAVGASDDPLEREADRVADQVMAAPSHPAVSDAPPRIQRFTGQPTGNTDMAAPASVDRVLSSPGRPLEPTLQQDMEQRFGHDFSQVRIHTDAAAERSAQEVSANAYTVRHNIVFGVGRFMPEANEGRRLIAHELTHVVQQSGADGIHTGRSNGKGDLAPVSPIARNSVQRQTKDNSQAQPTPDMMRIYSFGPTGAGKMQMSSGTTIFPPAARVDAKGNELVRAGTTADPILSRFGRYFTLDERHQPYPPPVPSCYVKAITEWHPDDGPALPRDQKEDTVAKYYRPGEPLGTNLGDEYIFPNDRPGVLTLGYVFTNPDSGVFIILTHGVHFVNDPTASPGATVLPDKPKSQGSAATASPEAKTATDAPDETANVTPGKKPESKGTPLPPPPSAQKTPSAAVGQIKELIELIKKTSDAAVKDTLVRKLRDLLFGLQPSKSAKDAKQAIDDAIRSFVKDSAEDAIMAILKAIAGKSPSTMPENRNQTGPDVPQKDLEERIFKGPKIPIKDAPALPPRLSFQYRNGPQKSYEAGASIRFTLTPPENFSSLQGAKRLVIVAESDRNSPNPERLARVDLESDTPKPIELQAPQKPGKYVIRVDIGLGFDYSNMQEFEVTESRK